MENGRFGMSSAACIALLLGWTGHAHAASGSTSPPDLSGIYNITGGFMPDPDADRDGIKPVGNHGELATAHLQPWARQKMEASSLYSAIDDNGAVCGPAGFFRHPTTVAGYMVLQQADRVTLVSEDVAQVGVRRIYLRSEHPRNLLPTWDGDSIGHWDGDTLVVDTVGFNDASWLGSELQPHSEELHVVERIRTVKDGKYLEITSTIDDRKALTGPYSFVRYYKRSDSEFEAVAESCNAEPEEQATWAYMRKQAIKQFAINRAKAEAGAPVTK